MGMPECNLNNCDCLQLEVKLSRDQEPGPLKMSLSETCTNLSLPALVGPEQVGNNMLLIS